MLAHPHVGTRPIDLASNDTIGSTFVCFFLPIVSIDAMSIDGSRDHMFYPLISTESGVRSTTCIRTTFHQSGPHFSAYLRIGCVIPSFSEELSSIDESPCRLVVDLFSTRQCVEAPPRERTGVNTTDFSQQNKYCSTLWIPFCLLSNNILFC